MRERDVVGVHVTVHVLVTVRLLLAVSDADGGLIDCVTDREPESEAERLRVPLPVRDE